MKKTISLLSFLALAFSLSLNAQSDGFKNSADESAKSSSTAKSNFINNQNYLSKNSLKDYGNYFGDSLKGFDEVSVKATILSKGLYGTELAGYFEILKRRFINEKYKIGEYTVTTESSGSQNVNTSKPSGKTIGGGNNFVNVAPCVNEGFESTAVGVYNTGNAVTGWSITSMNTNGCANGPWASGSSEFAIVSTPVLGFPGAGTIPTSPLGGNRVAKLNDNTPSTKKTKLTTTFPVTTANTLFQFAFAGYYENGGHTCATCDQPGFYVRVLDCNNQVLTCATLNLSANCPGVNATFTVTGGNYWTNWQVKYIDLTPYVGSCITVEVWSQDCSFSGHYGTTLFDASCGGQLIGTGLSGVGGNIAGPVSFCPGSGLAQISAPLGYASYTWNAPSGAPPISPSQINSPNITIANPIPNSVYTVNLTSPSGCAFTATNAITISSIQLVGVGTTTTCLQGASGSATIQANGSAAGYNYTWTSLPSNSVVGSASVATGLGPGVYSVNVTGLGSALCGNDATTVTITVGPPTIVEVTKPFCGNQAFLATSGGSNFKWWNGNTSPPTALAGTLFTASSQTVANPQNGQIYWLSYLSNQGCQDSVKFLLVSIPPGNATVGNISLICPGGNNGVATVSMTPAASSPFSIYSYSVYNTTTATPMYNATLFPTSATVFTIGGLQAGNYTAKTFDGSCQYTVSFNVNALVYNYNLTPATATLCPGNQIAAGATFASPPSPGQYSYTWSPSTWLAGGNVNLQNTIISPTVPIGTSQTVIYTVTVVPSAAYCPITKTLAITANYPAAPVFTPIPQLCNTSSQYAILVSPTGGTFSSVGLSPTLAPVHASSGILNPNAAAIGVNSVTYSITQGPCLASSSTNYTITQFFGSTLTNSVAPLCVTNAPVNLMSIVQSTLNGSWGSSMVPLAISNNSFNPAGLPTNNYVISYTTASPSNPTVCPSVSSLTVQVTHTVVPSIFPVNPFCTNASPFTMTFTPTGGIWSNPAISAAGVVTPSSAIPSNSIANYVVNIGPCVNTNSIILNIATYNSAALSGSISEVCATTANPINLMSIASGSTFGTWGGQAVSSNSFVPSAFLSSGNYTLTYTRVSNPDIGICTSTSNIVVSVLNPTIPVITQVGPYCSKGAAVQLSVSPATGVWVNSSYLTASGVIIPSLCAIGNNAVQYVIGTNTCNSKSTKYISVEAFASAATTGKVNDLCNNNSPVNLQPITQTNLGVWSGPGISGTSFNPASVGAGSFVLTYNTSSYPSGLCPDQSTLAVNVFSLAAPVITTVKRMCNSAPPLKLSVSPVGGLFGSLNSNAMSINGVFNPALGVIGDNIVNYSITSGPCVAYGQTTIILEKFISADLVRYPKAVYCQTIDKPINMNEFVANPGGDWTGPGIIAGSTMFNPDLAPVGINHEFTYQTYSFPTKTLCPHSSKLNISVSDIPTVTVVSSKQDGCAPWPISLNVLGTNKGTATWLFGDGSEPVQDYAVSHVYASAGSYTATLSYVNALGCPAKPLSINPFFKVTGSPSPDFSIPEEVLISNPQVQVTNLTENVNSNKYEWRVEGTSGVNNEINPILPFAKIGRYNITLMAESPDGCKAQITKPIEVRNDFNIFIPSSFSPNFDGLNDLFIPVFTPYGLDNKSFEMEIFDRWGHSLFRSKDVTKGWDGMMKGEPLKEEVYLYKIKFKDMDGNLYNKMGHVSLLR